MVVLTIPNRDGQSTHVRDLRVSDLRTQLENRELTTDGLRHVLVDRLQRYLELTTVEGLSPAAARAVREQEMRQALLRGPRDTESRHVLLGYIDELEDEINNLRDENENLRNIEAQNENLRDENERFRDTITILRDTIARREDIITNLSMSVTRLTMYDDDPEDDAGEFR